MTDISDAPETDESRASIERPDIVQWVWRPWYARLWWSLSAIYWIVGTGALFFQPLADFYTAPVAGSLHIAFFPVFAFVLFAFGWVRAWVDALDYVAAHPDEENTLGWAWSDEGWPDRQNREYWDPTNFFSPFAGTMKLGHPLRPPDGTSIDH